jgi:T5SS/PEP-CTERM-associated repeat protein
MSARLRLFDRRRAGVFSALIAFACAIGAGRVAVAAVATAGNVTPVPPAAGGNVPGALIIGDTGTGTVSIAAGTGLSVTGTVTVGDDAPSVGILTLSGLFSDLTITGSSDLVIGNSGVGFVSASNLARIQVPDDLFMGSVAGASGRLTIENVGTVIDVNDTVNVGGFGSGIIEILNGRMFADDTNIGVSAGSDGHVTVSGLQSLWQQTNTMIVGESGTGTLEILNHARVESTSAAIGNGGTGIGVATVSGAGSVWDITGFINPGASGRGTLNILDGASVTNTTFLRMATTTTGEGHVVVSGANSLLDVATTITVGDQGYATLNIFAGGRVTSTGVILADNTNSRGESIIDGEGSTWQIAGNLDISEPGEAMMTISNGGFVSVESTATIRANGTLVLNGGRLQAASVAGINNQGLIRGGGTLVGSATNTASGEIRVGPGDYLLLRNALATSGLVDVHDGELEVLSTVTNSGDIAIRQGILRFQGGLSNLGASQLAITGGEVDVYGSITNAVGGQIMVGGESHAAFHDNFTNNGTLVVTPGSELLTLVNLGFGASAVLNDQLGGDDPVEGFGRVHAEGTATLAGTLDVDLVGGFNPTPGDTFTILTSAGGVSGTFGTLALPTLAGGLTMGVTYTANSVILNVGGVAGDYNHNGVVDAADYVVYRNSLGQVGPGLAADGNLNGQVDVGDLTFWRSRFGATAGSGAGLSAGSAVPEPAALMLMALASVGCLLRRMRSR